MDLNIKWHRRFVNFEKALNRLKQAVTRDQYDELEQAGLIKTFEFTFELAWKTLKDLLEVEGYNVQTPREVIKRAFQVGYIENGETWLEILEQRNLMAHTYSDEKSLEIIALIKQSYFIVLQKLYFYLRDKRQ